MSEITDKRNLIRTLKEIKENLSYDYRKDYSQIYNACVEIDNKYQQSPYLTDYISYQDFVDEESLDYLIQQADNDIDRLRCFIGDTYSADIYKLDGYGNLQNVDSDDLKMLCDDLIEIVRDNLREMKYAEM